MFNVKDWLVPHLRSADLYSQALSVISDENPGHARMCLNENPCRPRPRSSRPWSRRARA